MYIVCVMLCLFSALSRRLGALQISIIIIAAAITSLPDGVCVTLPDHTMQSSVVLCSQPHSVNVGQYL